MAQDRTLLPTPFGATPEEDPAEFLRRLETYMDFKNHNEESRIRLARAMLVSASADWLQALPAEKKDTYAHLKAAFGEKTYSLVFSSFAVQEKFLAKNRQ